MFGVAGPILASISRIYSLIFGIYPATSARTHVQYVSFIQNDTFTTKQIIWFILVFRMDDRTRISVTMDNTMDYESFWIKPYEKSVSTKTCVFATELITSRICIWSQFV